MKVLYLHQYFVDPLGSGGTRSLEFGRRLARDGHEVRLVTSQAMMSEAYKTPGATNRVAIEGIDVVALDVPYDNSMSTAARVCAWLGYVVRSVVEVCRGPRPDVIIATSTPLTIAVPAFVARVRHRSPMVFEVRDLWPEVPIGMGELRNPVLRIAARLLERFAYSVSAAVIALSPDMAAGVGRIVRHRKPVVIVPNAADTEAFGKVRPEHDAIDPERFNVVYAGTLGRANDVAWLVSVADALPSGSRVSITVAGAGAERSAIRRATEELELGAETLRIIEAVPKREMPGLLAAADVCLSLFAAAPVLESTSPNKLFDALAAGRCVGINYGGWQAELIREHRCGIRLDRDPAAAAAQLAQLAGDPTSVREMGQRARALAETEFDREHLYRRWSETVFEVTKFSREAQRSRSTPTP